MNRISQLVCLVLVFFTSFPTLRGQEPCPVPPSRFSSEPNIFSPAQEMYLGEAVAEQRQRGFHVVDDPALNSYLQSAGDRLLKYLPENEIKYRFLLVDVPVVNAWGLPGGHVYVTRKMVAFLRNDEELEALLAHEIGHIYTHQMGIDYTRWFQQYLDVKQVGDRDDVFKRYNELLDNWRRKRPKFESDREEREQKVADQAGLYALARAGYSPAAMPNFFDRLAEVHGNTGGFFSDLFGSSTESNRRLREMLKTLKVLPANCGDQPDKNAVEAFQKWQQAVLTYSVHERKETLQPLIRKTVLNPPLQSDFRQVRFSPDGKYLLVQDDSGISVLTREPLAPVFRIPADHAHYANFSPDSRTVVFLTEGLRVEKWGVSERKHTSAHELLMLHHCWERALSPDGSTFACYDSKNDLRVIDVASGGSLYEKKQFSIPDWFGIWRMIATKQYNPDYPFHLMNLAFTPDGQTLVAAAPRAFLALDLQTKKALSVNSFLREKMAGMFAFMAPDSVVVVAGDSSGVYGFPSGKLVKRLSLRWQELAPATHGVFLMLRPIDKYPVGVLDTRDNTIVMANRKIAVDAYDDVLVSEARDGEVALTRVTPGVAHPLTSITLPRAEITRPRVVAASDDLNWIAYSDTDRGAVFDLKNNDRVMFTRGFRGAFFDGPNVYADFPKWEDTNRSIARMDLAKRVTQPARKLEDDIYARQFGQYLVVKNPAKQGGSVFKDITLEVQEVSTGHTLWSKQISGSVPGVFIEPKSGILTLASGITEAASESDKQRDDLPFRFDFPDEKKSVYNLELVDVRNGNKLGTIHINSGKLSFSIRAISASQKYVAVSDSENRVLLYSVANGSEVGRVFGGPAQISAAGKMAVVTEAGAITLFDCATLAKINEYKFPNSAIFSELSSDGKSLLVLTSDQTAYLLDTEKNVPADLAVDSSTVKREVDPDLRSTK